MKFSGQARLRPVKLAFSFLQRLLSALLIVSVFGIETANAAPPAAPASSNMASAPAFTPEGLFDEALVYFIQQKMGNTLPIKLDATSALPTVSNAQLPGGPFHATPLPLTTTALSQPLAPGDYELPVMAYCTQFSVHRPGRNAAGILAPLSGTQAKTITSLLWRGTQAGKSPQELQNAAWAIQNGVPFNKLSKTEQADIIAFAPQSRASLEQGFAFDAPIRELYNDIVANPRKYIIEYKHAKNIKFPPDIAIPNIKITAPSFDQVISTLGPIGRTYVQAEQDQQAIIKNLTAQQHGQEQPYVISTDPPLPPTQGPWTVRVPGQVYMRAIVQGGNMQSDNVLQIRVVSNMTIGANRPERARLVRAGYGVQQSQMQATNTSAKGPSVLALLGAPASGLVGTPAKVSPSPVRDPIGPSRDPIPTEPPSTFPGEAAPTLPQEVAPAIEGEEVLGVLELAPEVGLILFMVIAAQALIIVPNRVSPSTNLQTGTRIASQSTTQEKSDDECPGNMNHPALYRGGNTTSPRLDNVRLVDFPHLSTLDIVSPPGGISTFSTPTAITSPLWVFRANASVPKGLCVVNDRGNHWTWEPSTAMPLDTYKRLLVSTYTDWSKMQNGVPK